MKDNRIERRREILAEVFRKKLNVEIFYSEFESALKLAGLDVGRRAIQHTFVKWRNEFLPGLDIERIGREGVVVVQTNQPISTERKAKYPQVKLALGAALWELLFGISVPKGLHAGTIRGFHEVLDQKIQALRLKSNLVVSIDAGSTCEAAIEQLLSIGDFPIPVPTGEKDNPGFRFVSPTIFTNSLSIAAMIARKAAEGRVNEIELFLIGGLFRPDRGSIVGELAQSCLRSWQMMADLSVIGTTGFRPDHTGCPAFACDNILEAQMKLSMLNSWFRVVILDSSKLEARTVSNVFVPLSHPSLDLVVIDDGAGGNLQPEVNKFVTMAERGKVACLVVPMKPRSKSGAGTRGDGKQA